MSAKPLTLFACAGLLLGASLASHVARAADPVTLVLFPRTLSNDDDVKALVDVRKKLRSDTAYEVITYDPNSSAVKRAAAEAHHPEWLTDPMGNDAERLALTRALGAAFAIVIAKADGRGKMDVRVDEAAMSTRTWSGYDEKADDADRFIRQQAAFAFANRLAGQPASSSPAQVPARVLALPAASAAPTPLPPIVVAAPTALPSSPGPTAAVPVAPMPAPLAVPVAPAPAPMAVPNAPAPTAPALPPAAVPAVPIVPPAPLPIAPVSLVPSAVRPLPQPPVHILPSVPVPAATQPILPAAPMPVSRPARTAPIPPRVAPPAQAALSVPTMAVPPGQSKPAETLIVPSPLPIPAPSRVAAAPVPSVVPLPASRSDEDSAPVRAILTQGDDALSAGNFVAAIAAYRDAVNGAPLSMLPRLKLAQAYLQSDRRDKALSEAQRALSIAPNDLTIQQFLMQLDAETGSSDGAVARFQAVVAQSPQDPAAHLALADALWNNGALTQAENEYQAAQTLAGPHTPAAQQAAAHLARLYAAQSRYADSLAALKRAGAGGYALALGIVQSRADTLRSMLDAGLDSMDAGKTTHEAFYKTASDVAAQAQALADFVVKVTPPSAFGVSHLHRVLATHLMAQQAAVLVNYVETSDASFSSQAARLEKEAVTEMLTAHAAEQKLGLWESLRTEAHN